MRPSSNSPLTGPNDSQYTQALAMHQTTATVFNSSFTASHYASALIQAKAVPYKLGCGPSDTSASYVQSADYSYPYQKSVMDNGFPSAESAHRHQEPVVDHVSKLLPSDLIANDFHAAAAERITTMPETRRLTTSVFPAISRAQDKPSSRETTSRGYWDLPSTTPVSHFAPYHQVVQANDQTQAVSSPFIEPNAPYPSPVYTWSEISQAPSTAHTRSRTSHPAPFQTPVVKSEPSAGKFREESSYMWSIPISNAPENESLALHSQPMTDNLFSSQQNAGSEMSWPRNAYSPYQTTRSPFASPPQPSPSSEPYIHARRFTQRDWRDPFDQVIPSPANSTSSRVSVDLTGSPVPDYRAPRFATVNAAIQMSTGGDYIMSTGVDVNGGSASFYDNIGSSASGSGSNNGGNENVNGHGRGTNDGAGGYGGGGDGNGDGGDEEERRRQKKLTLACHFCRRRKLK